MNFTLVQRCHIVERNKRTIQPVAVALEKTEPGTLVKEVRRKMGIGHPKVHNRKKNYVGFGPSELRRCGNWKRRAASSSGG